MGRAKRTLEVHFENTECVLLEEEDINYVRLNEIKEHILLTGMRNPHLFESKVAEDVSMSLVNRKNINGYFGTDTLGDDIQYQTYDTLYDRLSFNDIIGFVIAEETEIPGVFKKSQLIHVDWDNQNKEFNSYQDTSLDKDIIVTINHTNNSKQRFFQVDNSNLK